MMEMRGWLTVGIRNEAWRRLTVGGGEGLDEGRKERRHTMGEGEGKDGTWESWYKYEFSDWVLTGDLSCDERPSANSNSHFATAYVHANAAHSP